MQESLAAESQEPMLTMLQTYIDGKELIAAEAAMLQFQKLLDQFGGHNERCRWQALQKNLRVFSCDSSEAGKTSNDVSAVVNSIQQAHTQDVDSFEFLQNRVAQLQAISAAQRIVFALGDDQHAVTLTANGRASDFAARQGVRVEVFVHRAVWLTGLWLQLHLFAYLLECCVYLEALQPDLTTFISSIFAILVNWTQ